jgi:hypothetical protein
MIEMKHIRYSGYYPVKFAKDFEVGDKIVRNFGIVETILAIKKGRYGVLKFYTSLPAGGKPDFFRVRSYEELPYA